MLLALALLALTLWWPTYHARALLLQEPGNLLSFIGITGLVLTVAALSMLTRRWVSLLWLWPLMVILVLVRITQLGLVQFSGAGFGTEFFIHLEWDSIQIAWEEYGRLVRRVVILGILLAIPAALLAFRAPRLSPHLVATLLLAGVAGLVLGRHSMPEWELFQAWRHWQAPAPVTVDTEQLRGWHATGLVEVDLPAKGELEATAPESPKNLIILYLESIGVVLADHPDWPDLMPGFKQLLDEYAYVDHVQASSYITIEGLTNSQCGTLFPFRRDNDSLASGDGLAEHMTCLGDVLAAAGYYQVYLGGAQKNFAGKAAFLEAHGYDEVYGQEEWRTMGLEPRPSTWGLSDADLFEQSLLKIQALEESGDPWNLTLLTIGTHIPGYFYHECQPYPASDDRFLNAIHCTDQLLTRWIERLERAGFLDHALLVITADHHTFPNPDMQALFGDAVLDRRLPFIVIGDPLPSTAVREGGGYDLAPTVLELLGIRHNARFALGRSLLDERSDRDYYFQRNNDIYAGEYIANPAMACKHESEVSPPFELPLDSCEKRALLATLGGLADAYSAPLTRLTCTEQTGAAVRIPTASDEPFEFVINQARQVHRFNRRGYIVDPETPGLYMAAFSANGELASLQFRDPVRDDPADLVAMHQADEATRAALLIWRPSAVVPDTLTLPIAGKLPEESPAIWLLDMSREQVIDQQVGKTSDEPLEFRLPVDTCRALFH